MTKDQLLAGFLDRSLSEDAMLQFQELRSNDPAFAQQVNDMMSVEQLLGSAAPTASASPEFLAGVENIVAAKVAAGTSTGFFSGLFSSTLTWVGITGALLLGAGALYLSQDDVPVETINVVPTTVEERAVTTTTNPQQLSDQQLSDAAPELVSPAATNTVTAERSEPARLLESTTPRTSDVTPDIATDVQTADLQETEKTSISSDEMTPALESLVRKLDGCIASNKHKECSQIALQVGRQFMQNDNPNSATKYYLIALDEARVSRIVNYEIEALGNLGTALLKSGQESNAKRHFSEAVELGEQNGIPVSQWRTALNTLK